MTRREALRKLDADSACWAWPACSEQESRAAGTLAPQTPHFPAKAKHVIFLFLNGGPSHVDTFDPKPALGKYDGKPVPGEFAKKDDAALESAAVRRFSSSATARAGSK